MQYFYQNLALGQSKETALHHAKLQYLEKNPTIKLSHPFYWASFVHIGNTNKLFMAEKTFDCTWLILGIVGGLGVLFLVWRVVF